MIKRMRYTQYFMLLVLFFAGLSVTANAKNQHHNSLTEAINQTTFKLYDQLKERSGNCFFSPYSIYSAIAMVQAGSKGNTLTQLNHAFDFPVNTAEKMKTLRMSLLKEAQSGIEWHSANSIWPDKHYRFLPTYIQFLKDYYAVDLQPQDFLSQPEQARITINHWVEKQTQNHIRDLLSRDLITPDTRLVLVNALYFNGVWGQPFDKHATKKGDFYLSNNKVKQVDMMTQQNHFAYFADPLATFIKLPYQGNHLSMVVILPKEKKGLTSLEKHLNAQTFAHALANMNHEKVQLILPRFRVEGSFELKEVLQKLGITDAFDHDSADFSGMDGSKSLFIGAIVHKAFVTIDEHKTEAAAATAVTMLKSMASIPNQPPVIVRVDHPFIFVIQDEQSGAILFMGRIENPNLLNSQH